jgi:DNA repair exonuclease SbcCD ATPase subunit
MKRHAQRIGQGLLTDPIRPLHAATVKGALQMDKADIAHKLASVKERLASQRSRCDQAKGRLELLKEQEKSIREKLGNLTSNLNIWRQAQALLIDVSGLSRERVRKVIEDTVTAALGAIVSGDLTFRVEVGDRGGRPTADWLVVSGFISGQIAVQPEEARGGGIVDVVSLALRMAVLELIRPPILAPLILDEPGKMVSEEYVPALAAFLRRYAESTGRQVLMVTHNETLLEAAHTGYRVTKTGGTSQIEELETRW